jgi:hypothetical protein
VISRSTGNLNLAVSVCKALARFLTTLPFRRLRKNTRAENRFSSAWADLVAQC